MTHPEHDGSAWVEDNRWTGSGHYIDHIPTIQRKRKKGSPLLSLRGKDIDNETCETCCHSDSGYRTKHGKGRKWCWQGAKVIYKKKQPACIYWNF